MELLCSSLILDGKVLQWKSIIQFGKRNRQRGGEPEATAMRRERKRYTMMAHHTKCALDKSCSKPSCLVLFMPLQCPFNEY